MDVQAHNIDLRNVAAATAFYGDVFGLIVTRRLGPDVVELGGWPVRLYLLGKAAGSIGADNDRRRYKRHWTPVHLDVVVDDLDAALKRAVGAGAQAEAAVRTAGRSRSTSRPRFCDFTTASGSTTPGEIMAEIVVKRLVGHLNRAGLSF
jgi:predicted enzyme related to lactoylglutathione lyase